MIDFIEGNLALKSPTYVVIERGGIGYGFFVSLNTSSSLPDEGRVAKLFGYTIIKDEKPQLFGFISEKERELFIKLISISGIGPKIALRILSKVKPTSLSEIIKNQDPSFLFKIKGIGEKTAKRIILELSGKTFKKNKHDKELEDSCKEALISLGYSKKDAAASCERALSKGINVLEELIKEALR